MLNLTKLKSMKTIKLSLSILMLAAISFASSAQSVARAGDWCGTDQHTEELRAKNPQLFQQNLLLEEYILKHRDEIKQLAKNNAHNKAFVYTIPIVFHVITNNGQGNVTKADIEDQVNRLNLDYQKLNSDTSNITSVFKPFVADIQVQFRLAHIDPNGNCTEGITRDESPLSVDAGNAVKAVNYWDSKKYFNVWTVVSIAGGSGNGIIAGYAQFPGSGINSTYGVVINSSFVNGSSRTLTHEIGHCMGLYHTFQSGCGGSCASSGDFICDTPPAATSSFTCNHSENTCSNDASGPDPFGTDVVDQIENYMSYNGCQYMFTLEQRDRMQFYLNSTSVSTGLNQLTTASNLAVTGTANPYTAVTCAPIADFTYDKQLICEGGSVTFTDNSYNAIPTAWNWSFSGGTPATSNASNPTITYNTAGVYSVTSQPSTTAGTGNITKNNIITVNSLTATYSGVLVDGFEIASNFTNDWVVVDPTGGAVFNRTTTAAATGIASVRIRNFYTSTSGEVDELISPSYNLSTIGNPSLKFKLAFARKSSTSSDRLLVWYSLNCGETWTLKLPLVGSSLATTPILKNTFWIPTASDWVTKTIDLSAISTATNVRFKFAFQSGGGNNLYLDDINIDGTTSVNDVFGNIGSFNVYPNPSPNGSATISFNLTKNVSSLKITVRDILGKEVTNVINNQAFAAGQYTLSIDKTHKLQSGVYFVQFNADNNTKVLKLIVQ